MSMNDQTPQTANDQFPNLVGYLADDELEHLISQHTTNELNAIESAFNTIESAMISIIRNSEIDDRQMLLNAITTIWDNSRDLAYDEDQLDD